jgi:hypothetical protein
MAPDKYDNERMMEAELGADGFWHLVPTGCLCSEDMIFRDDLGKSSTKMIMLSSGGKMYRVPIVYPGPKLEDFGYIGSKAYKAATGKAPQEKRSEP